MMFDPTGMCRFIDSCPDGEIRERINDRIEADNAGYASMREIVRRHHLHLMASRKKFSMERWTLIDGGIYSALKHIDRLESNAEKPMGLPEKCTSHNKTCGRYWALKREADGW